MNSLELIARRPLMPHRELMRALIPRLEALEAQFAGGGYEFRPHLCLWLWSLARWPARWHSVRRWALPGACAQGPAEPLADAERGAHPM